MSAQAHSRFTPDSSSEASSPQGRMRLLAAASASGLRAALLARAARPAYGVSIALAGVLAASWIRRGYGYLPLFGLDAASTRRALGAHFPGAELHLPCAWDLLAAPREFEEALELGDLVAMLNEHRTVDDEDGALLAHAIATACLGENHLWQDMNLPSRQVLSDLFYGFFNGLAVRNRADMKWKRFLYKQLCERAEIRICKSPSCGECVDYKTCFGSEV